MARLPTLLYQGRPLPLRHAPGRGLPRLENGELVLHGDPAFLKRRARDWLVAEARRTIVPLAEGYAKRLNKKLRRVTLKDTTSRWGSCSADGVLMFSWRLVMAPQEVLDYVVAHEAAHLVEMNHSAAFWAVVAEIYPRHRAARAWLKQHGGALHKIRL